MFTNASADGPTITDTLRDTGLTTSSGPNTNGVPTDNIGPDTLIIPITDIGVTGDTATTATGAMATTATGDMGGKIGRVLSYLVDSVYH